MFRLIIRTRFKRRNSFRRLLLLFVILCAISLLILGFWVNPFSERFSCTTWRPHPKYVPLYKCINYCHSIPQNTSNAVKIPSKKATDDRVLILVESSYSQLGHNITDVLNALKIAFKTDWLGKNLPLLTTTIRGRYNLIIFENYYKYLNLHDWNRQILDKYCLDYGVAVIGFMPSRSNQRYIHAKIKGMPLTLWQQQRVSNLRFSSTSSIPFIAKSGPVLPRPEPDESNWVLFRNDESSPFSSMLSADSTDRTNLSVVIHGRLDGIFRVILGQHLQHWPVKLAFVDSIRYLTTGRLDRSLDRYLQVDIDDIFVGSVGSRMTVDDVEALIESQRRIRQSVQGFVYNLGFSGKYFQHGNDLEDLGDRLLIERAANFVWFPHMWRHNQASKVNVTLLTELMTLNRRFAEKNHLPFRFNYSVAPHHAGVYPIHDPLFDAWRHIWGVQVTCTEEYPHLKPAALRRGFIYKDVMVLPRQTCGLFTHTHYWDAYPGGSRQLISNIQGGDLFFSLVYNPNFAHDRLGIYTFESLIKFVECWTNIRLKWMDPLRIAMAYFRQFPQERMPIWGNPCTDPRHVQILPSSFNCTHLSLPNVVILGPQKTGSTAMHSFLNLHPDIDSSLPNEQTFEEVQFFGGRNYLLGLDWYLHQFPSVPKGRFLFEKSATYFDSPDAPRQMHALLPNAKLVVILSEPVRRAYSWYQHMKAHGDETALRHSFEQVVNAKSGMGKLRRLRQRCINPGRYAHLLERWLDYYPPNQLLLIDGGAFQIDPVSVLNQLQKFIGLSLRNFGKSLQYSPHKGFYCIRLLGNSFKCLGKSKGRQYEQLNVIVELDLARMYRVDNIALHKLITKLGWHTPDWLLQQLQLASSV